MSDHGQSGAVACCGDGESEEWWENAGLAAKIAIGLGIAVLAAGVFALVVLLVMSLWNWLMPELLDLPALGYRQAAGLMLLCCILFGGIRGRDGRHDG